MKRNRATLIIIIAIALVLVGLAIFYFIFIRGTTTQPGAGTGGFPIGGNTSGGTAGGTAGGTSGGTSGGISGGTSGFQNQPQTFQQLRELSSLPVSGGTLFTKNSDTVARYIERGTGHIYEAPLSSNSAPYRISNTTIPKIYEAYWAQYGQGFIIRYLGEDSNSVQTFYAALKPASTSTQAQLTDGTFLSGDITALAVAPRQDRIFFLVKSGGKTFGIRANADGTHRAQLFSSTVNEWSVSWPENSTVALYTKPSANVNGYLYFLDMNSGAFTKVLNGVKGMTALVSPDASQILYSESSASGISLKLYDRKTMQTSDVGLRTLPEKCVWSQMKKGVVYCAVPDNLPSASYPDAWYEGLVSFSDNLWSLNLTTGETKMVLTPQSVARQTMDIINPVLDPQEHYLLFMNKKDLSLWALDLTK